MKFLFLMLTSLLLSTTTIASDDDPTSNEDIVKIAAGLSIEKCYLTPNGVRACSASMLLSAPIPITLLPVGNDDHNSHYRGIYSTVKELDGLRYIGIISINRYGGIVGPPNDEEVSYLYSIKVEILSDQGVIGEMSISLGDMSQLNSLTLVGEKLQLGLTSYMPHFSIGRPLETFPCPDIPEFNNSNGKDDPVICEPDIPTEPIDKSKVQIDLLKGRLLE